MAKVVETFTTKTMMIHGEIRKAEWEDTSWTDKDGNLHESKAMKIKVLDDNDDVVELYDKTSDAIQTYARGQVGTFTLRMDYKPTFGIGNYEATIMVAGFEKDAE